MFATLIRVSGQQYPGMFTNEFQSGARFPYSTRTDRRLGATPQRQTKELPRCSSHVRPTDNDTGRKRVLTGRPQEPGTPGARIGIPGPSSRGPHLHNNAASRSGDPSTPDQKPRCWRRRTEESLWLSKTLRRGRWGAWPLAPQSRP